MNVLHINTSQQGGAALCALRISNALRECGINTCFLSSTGDNSKYINVIPEDTYKWSKYLVIRFVQKCKYFIKPHESRLFKLKRLNALRQQKNNVFATLPCNNYKNLINHPWVKEADIIHLHWIANFVDLKSFFKYVKKPVVWTLHDQNPLMGCFHYRKSYENANIELLKLDKKCIKYKQKALKNFSNLNIVAISKSMEEQISNNILLNKYKCTLINNAVDIHKFIHIDKINLKNELKLSIYNTIFLFSAYSIHDKNKGLKELISALEILKIENSILICIGNHYNEIPKTNINIKCIGFINNENELSKYYSVSDFFVMPSYQESFGQTTTESLSCGTPVIAFKTGIAADIINDKLGVLCKGCTSDALVDAIKIALKRKYNSNIIRKYIVDNFSNEIISQKYINLYKEILLKNNTKESNDIFSTFDEDFYKQQKKQKKQVQQDNGILDYLDQRRYFYKMIITHPRYIAGWLKKKVIRLFK